MSPTIAMMRRKTPQVMMPPMMVRDVMIATAFPYAAVPIRINATSYKTKPENFKFVFFYRPQTLHLSGGLYQGDHPPPPGTVKSRQYASYWNAFLFYLFLFSFFLEDMSLLCWACFGLLVTSFLGFKARVDPLACMLCCLCTTESSDSPLVQHLLTS